MAIYYLDVDDEITSAAARIRDSSDNRIALVLPGGARVATSRINFRLLAREAKGRGKRLAIIAADPSVGSVARSAELPVFASVGDYERAEAAMSRGAAARGAGEVTDALDEPALSVKPPGKAVTRVAGAPGGPVRIEWPKISRQLAGGVAALLVLILAAAAFFFYPSASVTLALRGDPVGPLTLTVKVDPTIAAANDAAALVPGLSKAFPVEASGTFDATGQNVVDTAATGTVTFTNSNTYLPVPVLAGTQVTTASGIAFVTATTITVPKASVNPSFRPGTADVAVTAVVKGTSGNVAAGAIVKVPSDLANALVGSRPVTNKTATTGGTHTVTPQIQQSDIDAATSSLMLQIQSNFEAAINAPGAVPAGSTMFADSAKLGVGVCNPDPANLVGKSAATFDLDCQDTGTVTMAEMAGVRELATRRIRAAVRTGYSLVGGSESATLGTATVDGTEIVVPVKVVAMQVQTVDVDQLRAGIMGKSLDDAKAFLGQYGRADISLSPSWASTLPSWDFRIDIQLVVPTASPAPSTSAVITPSGPAATSRVTKPVATPTHAAPASGSPPANASGGGPSPSPAPATESPSPTPALSAGPSPS